MGVRKSLYSLIWVNLAANHRYNGLVTFEDITEFKRRFRSEGLSFLTNTLPTLGKALDRYHADKVWVCPSGFSTTTIEIPSVTLAYLAIEGGGVSDWGLAPGCRFVTRYVDLSTSFEVPVFLSGCLKRCLLGEPAAVDCLRQLTLMFYKLEIDYDAELVDSFLSAFVNTDEALPTAIATTDKYIVEARRQIAKVLCNTNPFAIRPRHGSGATACHTPNWDKWHSFRYFEKLDQVFPYSDHFYFSPTHLADELAKLEVANSDVHPRARVCLVPKDARGPRVISCEPAELMYIQQGLMKLLFETLESHELTRSMINFTDQTINRGLACSSSINNELATLDLSEASDRVSLALVRALFPNNWVIALEACRSEETELPSGQIVKLNKFAPMGSACCFPVEALTFWALATAAIIIDHGIRYPVVYVYGDDIIVDSKYAATVIRALESQSLLVNRSKSYIDGPFRESCGGDFYKGIEVTPIRLRKLIGSGHASLNTDADFAMNLIEKFGYESVHNIIFLIENERGLPFPRSSVPLPGTLLVGKSAMNDIFFQSRWNPALQRIEYRVPQVSASKLIRREAGWSELLRRELTRGASVEIAEYENQLRVIELQLNPGEYVDAHSIRTRWAWRWLG